MQDRVLKDLWDRKKEDTSLIKENSTIHWPCARRSETKQQKSEETPINIKSRGEVRRF